MFTAMRWCRCHGDILVISVISDVTLLNEEKSNNATISIYLKLAIVALT